MNALRFRLNGSNFSEIHPDIRMGSMNAMAFISKIQSSQPGRIEVEFDGSQMAMGFLMELAREAGYSANIEAPVAVFERF
jgi:hypothetical protein